MPIPSLVIPIVTFISIACFCYIEQKNKTCIFFLFLSLVIVVWASCVAMLPAQIEKTAIAATYRVDNSDVVSYTDVDNNIQIVNLNQKLGKSIPPGTKIRVTMFKLNYYGLHFERHMAPDKYEILIDKE